MSNPYLNGRFGETLTYLNETHTPSDSRRAERLAYALIHATGGGYKGYDGDDDKMGRFSSREIDLGQLEHGGIYAQATGHIAVETCITGEPANIKFAIHAAPNQPIYNKERWCIVGGSSAVRFSDLRSASYAENGLAIIAQAIGYNYRPVEEGFNDPFDSSTTE